MSNVVDLFIVSIVFEGEQHDHIIGVFDLEEEAINITKTTKLEAGFLYFESAVRKIMIYRRSLNGPITSGYTSPRYIRYVTESMSEVNN